VAQKESDYEDSSLNYIKTASETNFFITEYKITILSVRTCDLIRDVISGCVETAIRVKSMCVITL